MARKINLSNLSFCGMIDLHMGDITRARLMIGVFTVVYSGSIETPLRLGSLKVLFCRVKLCAHRPSAVNVI
jgi:hypothetical protein